MRDDVSKRGFLKLLREGEKFRRATADLLGLEKILKRLDGRVKRLVRLREGMIEMERSC